MALVNPNIAMSYRGVEIPNQLAQYGQLAQIQSAQQQNRLADMQMQEYARARTEEEGLRNYLAGADLAKPETRAGLMKFGKTGLAYGKALSEQETSAATLANVKSQTGEREFKLANDKLKHGWQSMGEAPTPQAAIEKLTEGVKNKYFTPEQAAAETQKLQQITTPEQYKQYRVEKILGLLDAKDQLAAMLPKVARQDIGGSIVNIQDNPVLLGYGQPIAGPGIVKTPTFGERTAQGQLGVSRGQLGVAQGQLGVAQQRLAQEGQGVTYQTDAQGNLMALPSRLSAGAVPMARPVTGEGGAPVKGKPSAFAEKSAALQKQQSKDISLAITEIEDAIKPGGLLEKSTASGAGKIADVGAAFFGKATPGAIAAASLKPIADLGLKMVPRFEGPQSDKDTASYKEAAGQLANEALPMATRKAAAETMVRIMKARKGQFANEAMAAEGIAPSAPRIAPPEGFTPDQQ
jgi:hypothetical protein